MEYLAGTPGENIPQLNMRVSCKHRGIQKRYEGMAGDGGVLLAERTEGIATVAPALAFCQSAERFAGCRRVRYELADQRLAEGLRILAALDLHGTCP